MPLKSSAAGALLEKAPTAETDPLRKPIDKSNIKKSPLSQAFCELKKYRVDRFLSVHTEEFPLAKGVLQ